jgi:hypothetical protein
MSAWIPAMIGDEIDVPPNPDQVSGVPVHDAPLLLVSEKQAT